MKNTMFILIGLLIGFSIIQYGIVSNESESPAVAQVSKSTTTENLKENLIIDPVEITAPEELVSQNSEGLQGDEALLSQALEKIQNVEDASQPFSLDPEASLLEEIEKEQEAQVNSETSRSSQSSQEPTEISITQ